jgi:hypothetical protein
MVRQIRLVSRSHSLLIGSLEVFLSIFRFQVNSQMIPHRRMPEFRRKHEFRAQELPCRPETTDAATLLTCRIWITVALAHYCGAVPLSRLCGSYCFCEYSCHPTVLMGLISDENKKIPRNRIGSLACMLAILVSAVTRARWWVFELSSFARSQLARLRR